MNLLFLAIGLALLVLAAELLRRRNDRAAVLLAVVVLAVAYDDLVMAAGVVIGEGGLLEFLNVGRYALHALLTPLLVVVVALQLAQEDVRFLSERTAWAVTGALVLLGVVTTVSGFEVVLQEASGVVRYVEPEPFPPVPAIITVVFLLVAGVRWRRAGGSSALLAGSVVMTLVSAMPQPTPQWPSNLGELVLLTGMVVAIVGRRPVPSSSVLVPAST